MKHFYLYFLFVTYYSLANQEVEFAFKQIRPLTPAALSVVDQDEVAELLRAHVATRDGD